MTGFRRQHHPHLSSPLLSFLLFRTCTHMRNLSSSLPLFLFCSSRYASTSIPYPSNYPFICSSLSGRPAIVRHLGCFVRSPLSGFNSFPLSSSTGLPMTRHTNSRLQPPPNPCFCCPPPWRSGVGSKSQSPPQLCCRYRCSRCQALGAKSVDMPYHQPRPGYRNTGID
ncbi:hypothetical protein F5Y14DRAFT_424612, partial [Nemania sp. NC0429]